MATGRRRGWRIPSPTWTPAVAPGGIAFYTDKAFPGWQGNLLVAGLRARAVLRLELDGEAVIHEERLMADEGRRIRDVAVGPDGVVYALTDDERDGRILRPCAGWLTLHPPGEGGNHQRSRQPCKCSVCVRSEP